MYLCLYSRCVLKRKCRITHKVGGNIRPILRVVNNPHDYIGVVRVLLSRLERLGGAGRYGRWGASIHGTESWLSALDKSQIAGDGRLGSGSEPVAMVARVALVGSSGCWPGKGMSGRLFHLVIEYSGSMSRVIAMEE